MILLFYVCLNRHAQITQNSKFAISLKFLKKQVEWTWFFLHADKHESFPQLIQWFLMGMGNHSQNSLGNVFTISIDLQHLDYQVFLNGDNIITDRHDQKFSNYSKQQACNIFPISWKRSSGWSSFFACRLTSTLALSFLVEVTRHV